MQTALQPGKSGFKTTVTVDQVGKQSWSKIFKDASLHCISKTISRLNFHRHCMAIWLVCVHTHSVAMIILQ